MNLIIIEGADNIGKNTIINELITYFDVVTIIHCTGPKSKIMTNKSQDLLFYQYANNIAKRKYDKSDVIIMNRSYYGEYVYGQLYRHRNVNDLFTLINNIDNILLSRQDLVIKYIQLYSDSIELRKKNEDNKSLANLDDNLMEKENALFNKVFSFSLLDKIQIKVNDGDNFKPKEEILNNIINFLNQ